MNVISVRQDSAGFWHIAFISDSGTRYHVSAGFKWKAMRAAKKLARQVREIEGR